MSDQQLSGARIAVTGAWGNLGTKLLRHLSLQGCHHLIGIDAREAPAGFVDELCSLAAGAGHDPLRVDTVSGDLTDWRDARWRDGLAQADRVVHLAAQNPFPEATWDDATASIDMNLHVGEAALGSGLNRLVFASSNHVMGQYLTMDLGPGELTPALSPGVGTLWQAGDVSMDSTVYAVAKIAGERIYHGVAARGSSMHCVCVRIGWCQPGENLPETLNAAGTPTQATVDRAEADPETAATERWYRGMWLSNRDFCQLFERALCADADDWPEKCIVVNGTSANRDSCWSLEETRRWLGYEPLDDAEAASSSGTG